MSSSGIVGRTVARENNYVGVTYNPKTHQITGEAIGNISKNPHSITGVIKTDSGEIILDGSTLIRQSESNGRVISRFEKPVSSESDPRIIKSISRERGGLTGYVETGPLTKKAFALVDSNKGGKAEILEILEDTK